MKILVLYHTFWTQGLIDCWKKINDVELIALPLPVADWDAETRSKIAKLLPEYAALEKPDFILDVNGAGLLPLENERGVWTAEATETPWIEWWWDDPGIYAPKFGDASKTYYWMKSFSAPNVVNFIWDQSLAREYSKCFERTWHYLPTATNPSFYHPSAAKNSERKFKPLDLCFLGTYYRRELNSFDLDNKAELEKLSSKRVEFPFKNYSEIINELEGEIPNFEAAWVKANSLATKLFSSNLWAWRDAVNYQTGLRRRVEPLKRIRVTDLFSFFAGDNWPSEFQADPDYTNNPADLSALYQASEFCLDLGNGQSFSSTAMRSYEIMACGGALLSNQIPDFDPEGALNGQVYLYFSSFMEFLDVVKLGRNQNERLRKLRLNAREYVSSVHSWRNRLFQMLALLKS